MYDAKDPSQQKRPVVVSPLIDGLEKQPPVAQEAVYWYIGATNPSLGSYLSNQCDDVTSSARQQKANVVGYRSKRSMMGLLRPL